MGHCSVSPNLIAGVHHHHTLFQLVGQQTDNISKQCGLSCTPVPHVFAAGWIGQNICFSRTACLCSRCSCWCIVQQLCKQAVLAEQLTMGLADLPTPGGPTRRSEAAPAPSGPPLPPHCICARMSSIRLATPVSIIQKKLSEVAAFRSPKTTCTCEGLTDVLPIQTDRDTTHGRGQLCCAGCTRLVLKSFASCLTFLGNGGMKVQCVLLPCYAKRA